VFAESNREIAASAILHPTKHIFLKYKFPTPITQNAYKSLRLLRLWQKQLPVYIDGLHDSAFIQIYEETSND